MASRFDKYLSKPGTPASVTKTSTSTPTKPVVAKSPIVKSKSRFDKYITPVVPAGVDTALAKQLQERGVATTEIQTLAPEKTPSAISEFGQSLANIPKGFVQMFTEPSENIKKSEEMLGLSVPKAKTTTEKVANVVSAPIRTIGKGFVRLFGPMVEPLATDIGETIAVNELANKVAKGEMPSSVLDDIRVLKKTTPQIVGDVSQAVLAAYTPGMAGEIAGSKVASGALKGMIGGTTFGVAQALSSGSKKPSEIASTIASNSLAGAGLGAGGAYVGGRIKEGMAKLDEAKLNTKSPEVRKLINDVQTEITRQSTAKQVADKISGKKITEPAIVGEKVAGEIKKPLVPEEGAITKPSTLAQSIEAKAVEKGLTDKGLTDLAEYSVKTVKEQTALIDSLIKTNLERMKKIISGEESVPREINPGMLVAYLDEYANKTRDVGLIKDLMKSPIISSEISPAAQTLRFLQERSPESAVAQIRTLTKARETAYAKPKQQEVLKLKEEVTKTKATFKDWNSFVESIIC